MSALDDQKRQELAAAKLAALILGEDWKLRSSESPDLVVTTPDTEFGLEVTSCYAGTTKRNGGSMLARESGSRQRVLDEIRKEAICAHPTVAGWAVAFLGPWTDRDDVEATLKSAIEKELEDSGSIAPVALLRDDASPFSLDNVPPVLIGRRGGEAPVGTWRYMPDHAGDLEVSQGPLQHAIDKKSKLLQTYRLRCKDVRLLVTALSLRAEGNVSVDLAVPPDTRGFDRVYFLHVPHYVVTFPFGTIASLYGRTPTSIASGLVDHSRKKRPAGVTDE